MSLPWAAVRSPLLALGTLGITAASCGLLGLAVLLPYVMHDFGVRPAVAALVMPAAYAGCSATSLLGGRAADRWGGTSVSAAGLTVMTAGIAVASQAGTMAVYLAGACAAGMGYGIVNPATSVMVDPGGVGGRGTLLSVKQAGVTLGGVASGLLLPPVAEHAGWPAALAAVGALQLLVTAAMLALPGGRTRAAAPPDIDHGYRLRPNLGGLYGLTMAGAQVTGFGLLTVYLAQKVDLTGIAGGAVFGAVLGVAVLSRVLWGMASDARPGNRSRPLQACALLGAAGFAVLAVPSPATVAIGALLIGGGAAAWNGAYLAAIVASGESSQGAALGRALLLINIGCIGGPLLGSAILATAGGWSVLWLTMAAAQGIGFVAVTRATITGEPEPG